MTRRRSTASSSRIGPARCAAPRLDDREALAVEVDEIVGCSLRWRCPPPMPCSACARCGSWRRQRARRAKARARSPDIADPAWRPDAAPSTVIRSPKAASGRVAARRDGPSDSRRGQRAICGPRSVDYDTPTTREVIHGAAVPAPHPAAPMVGDRADLPHHRRLDGRAHLSQRPLYQSSTTLLRRAGDEPDDYRDQPHPVAEPAGAAERDRPDLCARSPASATIRQSATAALDLTPISAERER